jgi:DsbC/DsbD-like thiol-disulfide interchange protein/cytochrome c biogenesis protein CcdA
MRGYRLLIALVLQVLFAVPALAAPNHIAAELVASTSSGPGGKIQLALQFKPEPGWHGYWLNPGDAGLGMTLTWNVPKGSTVGPPRYPVPQTLLISGLMNHVFEQDYAVLQDFTIPASARSGEELTVSVKAQWLACNPQICVPEEAELQTKVRVHSYRPGEAPPLADPRFWDASLQALPAPLGSPARFAVEANRVRIAIPLPDSVALRDPHLFLADDKVIDYAAVQTFSKEPNLLVIEVPRAKFGAITPTSLSGVLRLSREGDDGLSFTASPGTVPPSGMPLAGSAQPKSLTLPLLLGALVGGLLLNIMPCVFPILSLKALSLAKAGGSEAEARSEGLAYSAGVVIACMALGALLLALRAGGSEIGWAFQLQEPLVIAALLGLAVAITANLLGAFEFAVPAFAGSGNPKNAFATGLLAAFVATPCTGPFMAAAMGAALLLPVSGAMALFAALGLGIALPFLAIAFVPALRQRLPKPGQWMVTFRRWMALPMGLTAVALLWLASRVGGNMFAIACGVLVLLLLLLLGLVGRLQKQGKSAKVPLAFGLAVLSATAALGLPLAVQQPSAATKSLLPSQPFSEAALAKARTSGKPVFLYFTADWCLTCKVNEGAAIEREATRDAFAKAGVTVLVGDWTRRDPAITRFLTTQGAAGVPLYLWYPAGGGAPQQLPQVLTANSLTTLAKGG